MELTKEQSAVQAMYLIQVQTWLQQLDYDYLSECAKKMREENSFRESAVILSPNPVGQMSRNDLNRLKTRQLELILEAAQNLDKIKEAEETVNERSDQEQMLAKLFGL
jgi:hypothetical protein